jgi:hypothetical protein
MYKINEQKDDLYNVFIYYMKILKYDPSRHWIKGVCTIRKWVLVHSGFH